MTKIQTPPGSKDSKAIDPGHLKEGVKPRSEAPVEKGPEKGRHDHYDAKTGRPIPREKMDHGKGPVAWLSRVLARLAPPEKGATSTLAKQPHPFEQFFIARFQGGRAWVSQLAEGIVRFGQKSPETWGKFFQEAAPLTLTKKGNVEEIKNFRYRGFYSEAGVVKGAERAVVKRVLLVGDLQLQNAMQVEKFARIPVEGMGQFQQLLVRLASILPGDLLSHPLLMEWLLGRTEFSYLLLSHKVVDPNLAREVNSPMVQAAMARAGEELMRYGREATRGIALSAKTEERVAQQLNLKLRPVSSGESQLDSRSLSGGGTTGIAMKGLSTLRGRKRSRSGEEAELVPGFVPWYQLFSQQRKWKGRMKWYVVLSYFVAASAFGLFIVYLLKFLLRQ